MAYQSLYRRYRPRRFGEVLGQDQVVGALRNAVRDDRVGHAYLFSGPRGTGKTSTARILAKALNCTNLQDGEPCCECEACLSIEAGTSYDLQELDAASNNKVENVRDLVERVALGSPGRTKVYILDEVHMLSAGASNALLKTLEEPPPHVVFVLATTDPHKVLPTIRSRTQHFEFHLLPADVLETHVRAVVADAGLAVDDEAIEQVVRQGGGSARDTLSALDQVAAAGGASESTEHADALADAVGGRDTALALRTVADAVSAGRDPRILGEALLARLRDAFLVRMGAELPQATAAERERAGAWAAQLTDRSTTLALEEVGAALLEMRQAPDPRIPLEVALVRITRAPEGDVAALTERVERLERALATGGGTPIAAAAAPAVPSDPKSAPREPEATAAAPDGPAAAAAIDAAPRPSAEEPVAPRPATRPAPRSGSRPADAARAMLAGKGTAPPTGRTPPAEPRAATPAPPPPPRTAAARQAASADRTSEPAQSAARPGASAPDAPDEASAGPPPAPTPAPATTDDPQPDIDLDSGGLAGAALVDAGGLSAAGFLDGWNDVVLPKLAGMTKAMYLAADFVGLEGGRAMFAVGNDVSRQRSEEKRPVVESALAEHFGQRIAIDLVIDGAVGTGRPGRATAPAAPEAVDIDMATFHELEDAPADTRSGIDRLAEAFPGAEVVEDEPGR